MLQSHPCGTHSRNLNQTSPPSTPKAAHSAPDAPSSAPGAPHPHLHPEPEPQPELEPPYRIWSEAVQDAGIRANKPCTPAQIEAFERELGAELTPELRQLYLMHDGMQGSDDGMYRLLSLNEVREMTDYAHTNSSWFPSLANDDWKLRTFFSYDNMDNTNAAVYLNGPLRGCVAEWGGGHHIDLPTYRNVNQLLFRITTAVLQDQEIYQFEPPWSDFPAGPSPDPRTLSHDRHLTAALLQLKDEWGEDEEVDPGDGGPTSYAYLESCLINVTPMEDISQLIRLLTSTNHYVLQNLVLSLKHRNLDTWIGDDDERQTWLRGLAKLAVSGGERAQAIELLGMFRGTNSRRFVRYVLDHVPNDGTESWLKDNFKRHVKFQDVDGQLQYQIHGSTDWHPVGSKFGQPGEP